MLMDTDDLIISQYPDYLLLFSSWYLTLDTGDLLVTGVQIGIWEKNISESESDTLRIHPL